MQHPITRFTGLSIGVSMLCLSPQLAAADAATAAEIDELKARIKILEEKQAAAPASSESGLPEWVKSIELHGFLSTAYTWNFNEPAGNNNQFRIFDFKHNAFRVDTFQLSVLRKPKNPGEAGFRVDLDMGSNIPRVIHSAGLFDSGCVAANPGPFAAVPCGEAIDLRQAFASYIAPVGNGLQIDIGKFITHIGLEVIEGWESMNDNYSRSIGFGFAIPFTHTGIRTSYAFNDQISVMAMAANGWDRVDDNNDGKAFGAQVAIKPLKDIAFYLNYLGSPEQNGNDGNWRHLGELVWVTKPLPGLLPDFTFSGTYEFGTEPRIPGLLGAVEGHASWQDLEAILRYDWTPKIYTALRGEWFYDHDGARAGIANQHVYSVTFTPGFKITDNFTVRPEVRWDHASKAAFVTDVGGTKSDQWTAAINAVFSF